MPAAMDYQQGYHPQNPYQSSAMYNPNISAAPTVYSSPSSTLYDSAQAKSEEDNALLLTILGFFFGGVIVWAIVYFMYKNSISDGARRYAKISGILVLISIILSAVSFLLMILFVVLFAVGVIGAAHNSY